MISPLSYFSKFCEVSTKNNSPQTQYNLKNSFAENLFLIEKCKSYSNQLRFDRVIIKAKFPSFHNKYTIYVITDITIIAS